MAGGDALRTTDGGQMVRTLLQTALQWPIDAEATAHVGAGPYERSNQRTTQRNGHRERVVSTAADDVTVRIPKMRTGAFFPYRLSRAKI